MITDFCANNSVVNQALPVAAEGHLCHSVWVPDLIEDGVKNGYLELIKAPNALEAGDIDVQDGNDPVSGMNRIGFCYTANCSEAISNGSSTGQLCGITNNEYSNNGYHYEPTTPTFYRVVRK